MNERFFNFVYLTTNIITGNQYIGEHSTDNMSSNITKNYRGSGIAFDDAKKKYGIKNFKREILEFFETKQEAFDAQEKYIKKYNTLIPNGYNISPKGGLCSLGCHSEETKNKIKNSLIGRKASNKAKRNMQNRRHTEETKNKMSEDRKGINHPLYGKSHSKKSIEKMSNSHKGIIPWNKNKSGQKCSEKTKIKISIANKGKNGPNKNKKFSAETKEKMSQSHKKLMIKEMVEIPEIHKLLLL